MWLIEGRGRLVDPHTVEVDGKRFTAANILVATGAHPVMPAIPGIEHAITSNEALDLPALPRRVVIVGGGYIAVEFAGIFNGLGAEVQLVIRGEELLGGFDDDIRAHARLRQRGIDIRARTQIVRIDKRDHGVDLGTTQGDTLSADLVMYATGRRPNTRGIGLEEAGVRLDAEKAVAVDTWSRSTVPHIYAVGDVTDQLNLTPVAIAEGRALAETLFNDNPIEIDHRNVATAVFSQPPIGAVGLTEQEARQRHGAIDIYRARFRPMKHTLSGREERTLMKLIVDRQSDRVLGCPHARRRCTRDHPGPRHRAQMRRHQAPIRPDHRHPPDGGGGVRHHARQAAGAEGGGGGVARLRQQPTGGPPLQAA